MRIIGTNGPAFPNAPSSARRASGGSFTVSEPETSRSPAGPAAMRSVSGLDSLMALQGIESPTERKKRAVAKGRKALDVLDAVKLGMLDGNLDASTMARLAVAAEGLAEESGDPGLDTVLGEINLRVSVELAKAGLR